MFESIGVICFFINFFFKKFFKNKVSDVFFVNFLFFVMKFFKVMIFFFVEISVLLNNDWMFIGILNIVLEGIGCNMFLEYM